MTTTSAEYAARAEPPSLGSGAAWAGLLAAGIGGVTFGALTDLSETSAAASRALQWYQPAGSLSGVAIGTILVWFTLWAILHLRWKNKQLRHERTLLIVTCLLVVIALVATFPPFYELL